MRKYQGHLFNLPPYVSATAAIGSPTGLKVLGRFGDLLHDPRIATLAPAS
jgi:hypothetical protein